MTEMEHSDCELEDVQDELLTMLKLCEALMAVRKRRSRVRSVGVRNIWKNRRQFGDGHNLLNELRFDNQMFFNYTRLNQERFDYLLSLVGPYITSRKKMKTYITPPQRLAMTLRYLATGDSMQTLGFSYRCARSTVSVIVRETLSVIVHVLMRLAVQSPQSKAQWKALATNFHKKWNLPHCMGALDGRHMQIISPKASGTQFFNYKKTHSIILLALADADYTFTIVDIGAEGSQNDAAVLNNSKFGQRLRDKQLNLPDSEILPNSNEELNYYFVGDGIFQLLPELLKPFTVRKLTQQEAIFNYRLSRARRVVENAFGILVARWRIFRAPINCSLKTAENIVLATVCLHNFIMRSRPNSTPDDYLPPLFLDGELEDGTFTPGRWRDFNVNENGALSPIAQVARNCPRNATAIRRRLMRYLNEEGAVHWQVETVRKGFWGAHITDNVEAAEAAREEEEEVEIAGLESQSNSS